MRVLLVEDDELLGEGVKSALEQETYAVDWVRDGASAERALEVVGYDLMVLDLGLPERDGLCVLAEMRRRGSELPVLILTARDTVDDRVSGLDAGADDYLVKPFDIHELAARLRALLRRSVGRAEPTLRHGHLVVDPARHTATLNRRPVSLTRREFAILCRLLESRGRVLSRSRLEDALYGWDEAIESNAVEVYIHNLRKKLGKDLIRTIRGVGYLVDAERGSPADV